MARISSEKTGPASAVRPSRVRYGVVGFCFALAMITYIDRACMGVLATPIREELGLSMQQMAYVFSAFTIAYALFEVPSAWWGEKIGARRVMARIVCWWSIFTGLTAAVSGFKSLWLVRFLFGAGEAGAWPNATRVFSRWIPSSERGRVQGVFFSGAHLAAGLTPPLVLGMLTFMSWRAIFITFALLGFAWCVAWLKWFRDRPEEHPGVNAAELEHIRAGVGSQGIEQTMKGADVFWSLVKSRNVWLLCLVAFANSYGFYFVITWLPTFLGTLGFSKGSLALYAGLPLLCAVPADLLGGVTTDWLARRYGVRLGRAIAGGAAYVVAAAAMFSATLSPNPHMAAILMGVAGGASMFALAPSWASCIEIGAAQSGLISATMNTVGQVGAMLSPVVLAWLVARAGETTGGWLLPLQIIGGLYGVAALCWCVIDPTVPMEKVRRGQA